MKKKTVLILWIVAGLFLVCSLPLFVQGEAEAGVCGIVIAGILFFIGYRKRKPGADVPPTATGNQAQYTAQESKVYVEEGGTKYHTDAKCSGMKRSVYIPLSQAKKRGFSACKKCAAYGVSPFVRAVPPSPATTTEEKSAQGNYEFLRTKVAGVTFKNGRKNRQTILRAMHFHDAPFDKGDMELEVQRGEWEGNPAFGIFVNGEQIGSIPAEHVQFVQDNFSRLDGITHIEVYGGGEGRNFGAEITLRFCKQ